MTLTDDPVMILPMLERSHAEQKVVGNMSYRTYLEYPAPAGQTYQDALRDVLPSGKTGGVESGLPLAHQKILSGTVHVADIIESARLVKTPYETGRIAYAAKVTETGMTKAMELSRPGASLLTIYSEGSRAMYGQTLLEMPSANILCTKFLCGVWPGRLSAQPHSVPGLFDTLSEGGPNVVIVTAQTDGYAAELERTFFLNQAPESAKRPFETMMEARRLAMDLIRPGIPAADIDDQVLSFLEKKGYGDHILHRTGHGFGVTGHEGPWIARGSEDILAENMVVSVEPGIYIEGVGGFRHSDTVLVTADGCRSLTTFPDALEDMVFQV